MSHVIDEMLSLRHVSHVTDAEPPSRQEAGCRPFCGCPSGRPRAREVGCLLTLHTHPAQWSQSSQFHTLSKHARVCGVGLLNFQGIISPVCLLSQSLGLWPEQPKSSFRQMHVSTRDVLSQHASVGKCGLRCAGKLGSHSRQAP